jgi:hypothetical protein
MSATARKPDWRLSSPRYPCGHARTPENTRPRRGCRLCDNARAVKTRQRRASKERQRAKRMGLEVRPPRRVGVDELQELFAPGPPRPRRPYLVARNFAAILDEVRPLYEAAIAPRDSTDERQITLFPETDHV